MYFFWAKSSLRCWRHTHCTRNSKDVVHIGIVVKVILTHIFFAERMLFLAKFWCANPFSARAGTSVAIDFDLCAIFVVSFFSLAIWKVRKHMVLQTHYYQFHPSLRTLHKKLCRQTRKDGKAHNCLITHRHNTHVLYTGDIISN